MADMARDGLPRGRLRDGLVKAAQRWMEAHPRQPIHAGGPLPEVHTTAEPLIQGSREQPGDGSDDLPAASSPARHPAGNYCGPDPSRTKIRACAAEWGFLNPGHFFRQ